MLERVRLEAASSRRMALEASRPRIPLSAKPAGAFLVRFGLTSPERLRSFFVAPGSASEFGT
jgi:hypothetical protein